MARRSKRIYSADVGDPARDLTEPAIPEARAPKPAATGLSKGRKALARVNTRQDGPLLVNGSNSASSATVFELDPSDIVILPELASLKPSIPASTMERLRRSLETDKQLAPLVVYRERERWILLDGQNRLAILREHGRRVQCVAVAIGSADEARSWIVQHSLAQRSLSGPSLWTLRGRLYLAAEQQGARTDRPSVDGFRKFTTTDIAAAFSTSTRTLQGDAAFVRAVDELARDHGEWVGRAVLEQHNMARSSVIKAASVPTQRRVEVLSRVRKAGEQQSATLMAKFIRAATQTERGPRKVTPPRAPAVTASRRPEDAAIRELDRLVEPLRAVEQQWRSAGFHEGADDLKDAIVRATCAAHDVDHAAMAAIRP